MYRQGRSLGRQLSQWMPAVRNLCRQADTAHKAVWLLGRDMDVFHVALKGEFPKTVRYITGLNRENARKLAHRGKLESWLRSIGVRDGDILLDSGYAGSIYARIQRSTGLLLEYLLLTADPNRCAGTALSPELNTERSRSIILALEHSPKREVVDWDGEKRRPTVCKLGGPEGEQATQFLKGCVKGLLDCHTT